MKRKQKLSFVLIEHSMDCRYRGKKENPWSGIVNGSFFGNFAGNPNVKYGRSHYWITVTCNCTTCPAIKAVHSSVLVNI